MDRRSLYWGAPAASQSIHRNTKNNTSHQNGMTNQRALKQCEVAFIANANCELRPKCELCASATRKRPPAPRKTDRGPDRQIDRGPDRQTERQIDR
eukprot:5927023-Pyramimonas_sp.AAC.1